MKRGNPQRAAVSSIPGDPLAVSAEYLSDFQGVSDVQVYTDYWKRIAEAPIDEVNDAKPRATGGRSTENPKPDTFRTASAIGVAANFSNELPFQ